MASIYGYHSHHCNGHEYIKHYVAEHGEGASTAPLMGIELEVDKGGNSDDAATAFDECFTIHDDPEFLMFEDDGSLSDGFEIITNPATLQYHKRLRSSYEEGFRTLVHRGYRSYNTTTCGMHVHVNRTFFGLSNAEQNDVIERVIAITEKFWDELLIFSRRDNYTASRWAAKFDKPTHEIIEEMIDERDERYNCINLQNEATIEFRIFKGTLNPRSFFATLELVNNICKFALCHTADEVNAMSWSDLLDGEEIAEFWERVKDRIVQ